MLLALDFGVFYVLRLLVSSTGFWNVRATMQVYARLMRSFCDGNFHFFRRLQLLLFRALDSCRTRVPTH